jgi:thiosulfate dehydrogenase
VAARLAVAAWLKVAMPLHEADLTDAESLDIAASVNSHDRPAFDIEEHLPPAEQLGVYNGKRGPAKADVQEKTLVRE